MPAHDRQAAAVGAPIPEITPAEAQEMLERDRVQLIDVREPWEYEEAHIPGCRLIPMGDVPARVREIDPEVPAIVYCRSGSRSGKIVSMLRGAGYGKALNLKGGILAWVNAQLPVEERSARPACRAGGALRRGCSPGVLHAHHLGATGHAVPATGPPLAHVTNIAGDRGAEDKRPPQHLAPPGPHGACPVGHVRASERYGRHAYGPCVSGRCTTSAANVSQPPALLFRPASRAGHRTYPWTSAATEASRPRRPHSRTRSGRSRGEE